jgi:predicted transcriptional regulator of viral defense system
MDDASKEARRSRSGAIFNNRYFVEVSESVLDVASSPDGLVTTRAIAAKTGLADSLVRSVMVRLADAGLIERLPRLGGGRSPQYYRIVVAESLRSIALLVEGRSGGSDSRFDP